MPRSLAKTPLTIRLTSGRGRPAAIKTTKRSIQELSTVRAFVQARIRSPLTKCENKGCAHGSVVIIVSRVFSRRKRFRAFPQPASVPRKRAFPSSWFNKDSLNTFTDFADSHYSNDRNTLIELDPVEVLALSNHFLFNDQLKCNTALAPFLHPRFAHDPGADPGGGCRGCAPPPPLG